jgi:AraC-like DNA-binding protein
MQFELLYLVAATQFFGFSFRLFFKKRHNVADNVLGVLDIFIGIYFIVCWMAFDHGELKRFVLYVYCLPLLPLIGPFLYIYTRIITSKEIIFKIKYLWYFTPFVIHYLLDFIMLLIYGQQIIRPNFYLFHPVFIIEYYFKLLLPIFYLILILKRLNKFKIRLLNKYSNIDKIDYNWLRTLVLYFSIGYIVFLIVSIIGDLTTEGIPIHIISGMNLFFSISYIFVGYVAYTNYYNDINQGFNIGHVIKEIRNDAFIDDKNELNKSNLLNDSQSEDYINSFNKLIQLIKVNKLYLEPDLNLGTLAAKMNLPSQRLSSIINLCSKKNFFDFINDFRVDEVKRILQKSKILLNDIVSIGMDCGFNSKSSFFRIFKNHTGLTPRIYHQQFHEKDELIAELI